MLKKKDEFKFEQVLNRTITEIKHKTIYGRRLKGLGFLMLKYEAQEER